MDKLQEMWGRPQKGSPPPFRYGEILIAALAGGRNPIHAPAVYREVSILRQSRGFEAAAQMKSRLGGNGDGRMFNKLWEQGCFHHASTARRAWKQFPDALEKTVVPTMS